MKTKLNKNTYLTRTLMSGGIILCSLLQSHLSSAIEVGSGSAAVIKNWHTVNDTLKIVKGIPLKPEDVSPLLIGEQMPMVNLLKSSGERFDLNKSIAKKPTILVFYRGGWCPYCSKQLSGMQEIEQDLIKLGYQVIAISTDSPENLSKTLNKQKLSYTLLSDADLTVAKKFGIAFKGPKSYDSFLTGTSGGKNVDKLLPVPSVFIIGKKGNILFEYINPNITQRLSASLLKAAAGALKDEI